MFKTMEAIAMYDVFTYQELRILVELIEELRAVGEDEHVGLGGDDDPLVSSLR